MKTIPLNDGNIFAIRNMSGKYPAIVFFFSQHAMWQIMRIFPKIEIDKRDKILTYKRELNSQVDKPTLL